MKENLSIHTYLKLINKEIFKLVHSQMQEYNLTKSQMDILRLLAHSNSSLCQKDIQDALHVTNPTVTGLLNRMETKGLIQRVCDPMDHRIKTVQMTPLARKLDQNIKHCLSQVDQTLTQGLSPNQIDTLKEVLPIILSNLEGGCHCDTDITCTSERV